MRLRAAGAGRQVAQAARYGAVGGGQAGAGIAGGVLHVLHQNGVALAVAGYVHRHRGGAAGIVSVRTAGAQHPVYFYVETLGAGTYGRHRHIHRHFIIGVAGAALFGTHRKLAGGGVAVGRHNARRRCASGIVEVFHFDGVALAVARHQHRGRVVSRRIIGKGVNRNPVNQHTVAVEAAALLVEAEAHLHHAVGAIGLHRHRAAHARSAGAAVRNAVVGVDARTQHR